MSDHGIRRITTTAIGLVAVLGGATWSRLLVGAVPVRGRRESVRGIFGFESIYSSWGFIPLALTLLLVAGGVTCLIGPGRHHLVGRTVVAAAFVYLSSWAGYAWYHHGAFVGPTSSHGLVDDPALALSASLASLVLGLAIAAATVPAALGTTSNRSADAARIATTIGLGYLLAVCMTAAVWREPVVLYLVPLFGLPWSVMMALSGRMRPQVATALLAMVVVTASAVLPVMFDLRDPIEFIYFIGFSGAFATTAAVMAFRIPSTST